MALATAPRPATAGIVHASWSIKGGVLQALAALDADVQIAAAVRNLLPPDGVEAIHELDHKIAHPEEPDYLNPLTGKPITLAEGIEAKNKFFDIIRSVRPDLTVINTLTAGLFYPGWGGKPEPYGAIRAHMLGVDFDGIKPINGYPDWRPAYPLIDTFAAKYYGGRKCAPEVGVIKRSDDPTGLYRGVFLGRQRNELETGSYEFACEFGYGTPPATDAFADEPSFRGWTGR